MATTDPAIISRLSIELSYPLYHEIYSEWKPWSDSYKEEAGELSKYNFHLKLILHKQRDEPNMETSSISLSLGDGL